MNYLQLLQKGLRFVVKSALQEVQQNGFVGDAHFYITFKTNFPGVQMPADLLEEYPKMMTIVLQHEFWNLKVYDQFFNVDLLFEEKIETLSIPFTAIYKFEDPNEPFALDFMVDAIENPMMKKAGVKDNSDDNVINLDDFRKK